MEKYITKEGDFQWNFVSNYDLEVMKLMINNPTVDLNVVDIFNLTAFGHACENGNIRMVKLLFKDPRIDHLKSVPLSKSECSFRTFEMASFEGFTNVCKWLLSLPYDINTGGEELHDHFRRRYPEFMNLVQEYQENPYRTRITLRRELKRDRDIIAMVILFSDGYLRLKEVTDVQQKKSSRFFLSLRRLPLMFQMMICKRIYLSEGFHYPPEKMDKSIKEVLMYPLL